MVELIDIFPTLTELTHLPTPPQLDGVSLLKQTQSKDLGFALSEYSRSGYQGWSMRVERYRYTEWLKKGQPKIVELYDHQHDPQENNNISAYPENRELVLKLSQQLSQLKPL